MLVVLLGALLMAARTPMWGSPVVELDVSSEALRFVVDGNLDLVGRSHEADRPGATGVPLATPWIYLRGVRVVTPEGEEVEVPEDRAVLASELQQLAVSRDCAVNITTFPDGYVRLAISRTRADSASACSVRGTAWSDPTRSGPDSLGLAPLLENVPASGRLEIRARPGWNQPAVLQVHPARPLRISRIPVSRLSFETLDRGRYPESSILNGTLGFPGQRTSPIALGMSDTLSLDQPRGTIVDLTIGGSVRSRFSGTASAARTPSRGSIKPTLLDQVQSSPLLLAIGAIVSLLAGLADLTHLMGRRE
ncbi:MAG TPA: hypothetical protein VFT45_08820 [Longimicrobium sp.]|nr:hypothetical protein [Longimicrobium sp.]